MLSNLVSQSPDVAVSPAPAGPEAGRPSVLQRDFVDYSDQRRAALEQFANNHTASEELTGILTNVAKTGITCYSWDLLKVLIMFKVDEVLQMFFNTHGWGEEPAETFLQQKQHIMHALNGFPEAPWTLQRVCELVLNPALYSTTKSLIFAIEKLVNVSSTQAPLLPEQVITYNQAIALNNQQQAAAAAAAPLPGSGLVEEATPMDDESSS
eukprot:TRINITY_DN1580_c0_g1_i1.p1 TRINITY_DN1580_c0_g1~~TRINITY_DN1580_c0_g1_i1.p1  ORF type:complete len:231 (+),score=66.26 TRINITY_DN1580_c0_g1_i1:66-695(+)